MSDLRVAALEGCSICGTYYAGLHMLDSEACRYGDNDLSVKIKNDGSYVAVQKSNSLFIQNEYDFWNVPSALEGKFPFILPTCLLVYIYLGLRAF